MSVRPDPSDGIPLGCLMAALVVGWGLVLVLSVLSYMDGYIADRQAENREAITPDTVKVFSPSPQASVDEYRARADTVGKKLERAEESLSACMADRSMLQAEMGVHLPPITVTKASR